MSKNHVYFSLILSLTPTTSSSSSSSILISLSLSLSEIPMDVTLSSNPQTLTLISCTPFSSSSSSKLRSIRREFLGSTQTLRPLRSRTNHRRRKLGLLQFQSPKFLIRASLDSRSVLIVVAVVTFSVVSVFFLNRYRRKSNDSEVRQLWIIYYFEFFALNSLSYTKLMYVIIEEFPKCLCLQHSLDKNYLNCVNSINSIMC